MIQFISQLNPKIKISVAEEWMWSTEAFSDEESFVSRAVDKRKREFRAGRHAAHKALESLGHPNFSLKVGDHRQPIWPEGIIGSISHTDGFCACVALSSSEALSIGIDVEPMDSVDKASLPLICTRKELSAIESLQNSTEVPLCKLIFSAKECVHKVYYPVNKHTLDFLDAEINLNLDNRSFTAHINNPEKNPARPIKTLEGFFHFDKEYLYTVILKERD